MGKYAAIYIPDEYIETWRKFIELCNRERVGSREGGASKKIREWATKYVREHYPGNPQPPLTKFMGSREAATSKPPVKKEKRVPALPHYEAMSTEKLRIRLRRTQNQVTRWLIRKELEKREVNGRKL